MSVDQTYYTPTKESHFAHLEFGLQTSHGSAHSLKLGSHSSLSSSLLASIICLLFLLDLIIIQPLLSVAVEKSCYELRNNIRHSYLRIWRRRVRRSLASNS